MHGKKPGANPTRIDWLKQDSIQTLLLNRIHDNITITDLNGIITYVNDAECITMGMTREELIGKSIEIFGGDEKNEKTQKQILQETLEKDLWRGETNNNRPDGSDIVLDTRIQALVNDQDTPVGLLAILSDITEQKRIEKELADRERLFRSIFEFAPVGINLATPKGIFKRVNRKFCSLTGYSRAEVEGLDFRKITHPDDVPAENRLLDRIFNNEMDSYNIEKRYVQKNGSIIWVDLHVTILRNSENMPETAISICNDITDRKKAESALLASESQLALRNRIAEAFFIKTNVEILYSLRTILLDFFHCSKGFIGYIFEEDGEASIVMDISGADTSELQPSYTMFKKQAWKDIWGRPLTDKDIHYSNSPLIFPWNHTTVKNAMTAPIIHNSEVIGIIVLADSRYAFTEKDKHLIKTVTDYLSPLFNTRLFRLREEKQRRLMEKELREAKHFLEEGERLAGTGWWYYDMSTQRFTGSDQFYTLLGKDPAAGPIALSEIETSVTPTERKRLSAVIRESLEKDNRFAFDTTFRPPGNASPRTFNIVGEGVIENNGSIQTIHGVLQDITEKPNAEEQIRRDLEKKVLLQEIHHRVKNNLQIISSLLTRQSSGLSDPKITEIFTESRNRIDTIALIHERLYQTNDIARIDFADYTDKLIKDLVFSYGAGKKIETRLHCGEITLELDQAIPCGLILQELISNAFKHAFPDGSYGRVDVDIIHDEGKGECLLRVADNVCGMDLETTDPERLSSLGLRLVSVLTGQLEGELNVSGSGGTCITIIFPCFIS